MATTLQSAVESYARARNLSRGTRNEYAATVKKWVTWNHAIPIEQLSRRISENSSTGFTRKQS